MANISGANFSGVKWPRGWGSRELWAKCEVLQIFFLDGFTKLFPLNKIKK